MRDSEIKKECYTEYLYFWIKTHANGHAFVLAAEDYKKSSKSSFLEYVMEHGIGRQNPVSYEEFLMNEFKDDSIMNLILKYNKKLYDRYLLTINRSK